MISLWTLEYERIIYNVLLTVLCILYTQYQNTLVFNWTIVLFWKIQFPLDFNCVTIAHLMCCIPYCKINIKGLNRIAIWSSTSDYQQHQPTSTINLNLNLNLIDLKSRKTTSLFSLKLALAAHFQIQKRRHCFCFKKIQKRCFVEYITYLQVLKIRMCTITWLKNFSIVIIPGPLVMHSAS